MQETIGPDETLAPAAERMKIVLLGGSNAGLKEGWAAQLGALAASHVVDNRFLGAVGSLYGLMSLLKLQREGAALPDLIVFEYCLNDMLLVDAGVLKEPLIVDALHAVVNFCADARIALLFLCLEPRPDEGRSHKAIERVQPLYAAAARRADASCLWLSDIFRQGLTAASYQDENHLTREASSRVARAVLATIAAGVKVPHRREGEAPQFDYVDATQARGDGPCRLRQVTMRVFEGPFLEIARGGSTFWPGRGKLVGLMLRSTDSSGSYLIRAQGKAFRKNPRSQMQEIVKNLVLLHYATRAIWAAGEVEIAMPEDETALMSLPEDRTLLAVPAPAPFMAQTLDIHGLMFWRRRSLLRRIGAYLKAIASGWRSVSGESS